jgi:hypothetical protein
MARERREVWEKRVARLRESGLTTNEFAAEIGCNAGTLQQWKYKLAGERRRAGRTEKGAKPVVAPTGGVGFVEVIGSTVSAGSPTAGAIEVMLGRVTVRVPPGFDADTLCRLVTVLEQR